MNRKASLSLSINAIVILVLAIAMLGLGLGFTKGMFAKFGSKLDVPPPNIPATADEQVVLPQEELSIKHGKDFAFSVNYYNDFAYTLVKPGIYCGNLGKYRTAGAGFGGGFYLNPGIFTDIAVADQDVDGGLFRGFKFIVKGQPSSASLATGTADLTNDFSICTIYFQVCDDTSTAGTCDTAPINGWPIVTKQITIKIT